MNAAQNTSNAKITELSTEAAAEARNMSPYAGGHSSISVSPVRGTKALQYTRREMRDARRADAPEIGKPPQLCATSTMSVRSRVST